jgi:NAD(P)-dependent dehydrogenase (short-subunit alcohol dehydrogenase family)
VRPIDEQVVLVTGSTNGLGRAVARVLAARGATVLMHGRDAVRAEATLREIRSATGNEELSVYQADLASLDQVRSLGEQVLAEHERLDVLVNNAGVGFGPRRARRELSADGVELRLAVNYLAPFLLTRLLEPLLVDSAPARIVNVASAGQAPIDFGDLMLEGGYDGVEAYRRSKLALVMLTLDLADELRDRGVTANSLHPGTFMPTGMVREAGINPVDSLETGVDATLRLIADPALESVTGKYFERRREARALPQAYDLEARRRLRELTGELVGLRPGRLQASVSRS